MNKVKYFYTKSFVFIVLTFLKLIAEKSIKSHLLNYTHHVHILWGNKLTKKNMKIKLLDHSLLKTAAVQLTLSFLKLIYLFLFAIFYNKK